MKNALHIVIFFIFLGNVAAQKVWSGKIVLDSDTTQTVSTAKIVYQIKIIDRNGRSTFTEDKKEVINVKDDGTFDVSLGNDDVIQNAYVIPDGYYKPQHIKNISRNQLIRLQTDHNFFEKSANDESSLTAGRTKIDNPEPIDIIHPEMLSSTGKLTLEEVLNYTIPSLNASNQPISDATAHYDPVDLRNLGPGRTLFLIEGKRKNSSALIFTNDTPAKGEVGVDIKSIPLNMIKNVEVLRDGASSRFGSDAIAGIVNFELKGIEYSNNTDVKVYYGGSYNKTGNNIDGQSQGYDLFKGIKLKGGGFFNVAHSVYYQDITNRRNDHIVETNKLFLDSLRKYPDTQDWNKNNPGFQMTFGQPQMLITNVFYNTKIPLNIASNNVTDIEFYSFGGVTYRNGKSFGVFRAPYVVRDNFNLLHAAGTPYQGYQPTFETDIIDNFFNFGTNFRTGNWKYDISHLIGKNDVDYTVKNTLNPSLGANSPTVFYPGGYTFSTQITNFDIQLRKNDDYKWLPNLSFGSEFKTETYTSKAGDRASSFGQGSISFPGISPDDAFRVTRNSLGIYTNALFKIDIDEDWLKNIALGGSVRYEPYSDITAPFSDDLGRKANFQISFQDNLVLRGSYSFCFRAPTLHQRHLRYRQTLLANVTLENEGILNNDNPLARSLGISLLSKEKSENFSLGGAWYIPQFGKGNVFLSVDLYQINLYNRIVYSSSISSKDPANIVNKVAKTLDVGAVKFLINGVNTQSKGLDFVFDFKNILGNKLNDVGLSVAANVNQIEITHIETPSALKGIVLFNRTEQSRIESSRPNTKIIGNIYWEKPDFKFGLNYTYFGKVKWKHPTDESQDQELAGKSVLDAYFLWKISQKMSINVALNNFTDTYPDEIDTAKVKDSNPITLGGRFNYLRDLAQFGYNGRSFNIGLNFHF